MTKRNAPWSKVVEIGPATLYLGDCVEIMRELEPEGVHSAVTDPPYELGFNGHGWDKSNGVASDPTTWEAARTILKPGAHLLAFSASRTYHRITMAIEIANFEIRDQLMWLYGSGFPKNHDIAKAIDKEEGSWRGRSKKKNDTARKRSFELQYEPTPKGQPITENARRWAGWGTALKPAHEPIALARKPFRARLSSNVLKFGTGAINVDGTRIHALDAVGRTRHGRGGARGPAWDLPPSNGALADGRWPANVIHDGSLDVLESFPETARGAARFYYSAKATREDREFGMTPIAGEAFRNLHPTVKPIDLMRWLCRLITPPDGIVIDPFTGSGSTGIAAVREGFRFIGIEKSPEYFEIACERVAAAVQQLEEMPDLVRQVDRAVAQIRAQQFDLFTSSQQANTEGA